MSLRNLIVFGALAVGPAATAAFLGCGHATTEPHAHNHTAEAGDKHDGWWCGEHGVPEDICARCNVKLVADFKAKNDWCQDHDRPDSQCFICHPEKQAEFAAQYEAKYGKQPPKPDMDTQGDDKAPGKS